MGEMERERKLVESKKERGSEVEAIPSSGSL